MLRTVDPVCHPTPKCRRTYPGAMGSGWGGLVRFWNVSFEALGLELSDTYSGARAWAFGVSVSVWGVYHSLSFWGFGVGLGCVPSLSRVSVSVCGYTIPHLTHPFCNLTCTFGEWRGATRSTLNLNHTPSTLRPSPKPYTLRRTPLHKPSNLHRHPPPPQQKPPKVFGVYMGASLIKKRPPP